MKWLNIMTLALMIIIAVLLAGLLICTLRLVNRSVEGSIIQPGQHYTQGDAN